ncbi:MAG: hypothetical protein EGS53_10730 [Prevotella sp.]|nr:hypothetical protein [Prevotella sp.]
MTIEAAFVFRGFSIQVYALVTTSFQQVANRIIGKGVTLPSGRRAFLKFSTTKIRLYVRKYRIYLLFAQFAQRFI